LWHHQLKDHMHICLMTNCRLYFAFFVLNCEKKIQNKFLLHDKAKNFFSLHVLKATILSSLQNQTGCERLNLENKLWKGVMRHYSLRKYLWCEGSVAFEHAHKAFFHSGVICVIYKMKKFNVKTLFVTQACLQVLH